MRSLVLIVPGHLDTRTGGYEYDRRIIAGLCDRGWSVQVQELDESFPHPTVAALDHAADVLAELSDKATVLIDGLALGAMPDQVEREANRLYIVGLVHLPLAAEIGLDPKMAERLAASERRALAAVRAVVVTGQSTVQILASYGIELHRIVVIEPGTDRVPLPRRSRGETRDGGVHLLTVATPNAGKGHEVLFRALATIPDRRWRLTCAGSLERDRATVERLRTLLLETGLSDRVSLVGELDRARLETYYESADVFVLPTLHETYGMAVAEALAHGLPVVSTTTGAIPELVKDEAGLLVPPGDPRALAEALSRVLDDEELRARLADGAVRARDRLPTWEQACEKMAAALERVATDG